MKKTVNEILKIVDALKENTFDTIAKLQWINEVDGNIWTELFQYKVMVTTLTEDGVSKYDLPPSTDFNRVTNIYMDGVEIPKLSNSQYKTTGYSRVVPTPGGGGVVVMGIPTDIETIEIYPTPTAEVELAISFLLPFEPHDISDIVNATVLAESPFEKIYVHYISAMIDFHRQEYDSYNNMINMFNNSYVEYMDWLVKNKAIERRDWNCNSLLQNIAVQSKRNRT